MSVGRLSSTEAVSKSVDIRFGVIRCCSFELYGFARRTNDGSLIDRRNGDEFRIFVNNIELWLDSNCGAITSIDGIFSTIAYFITFADSTFISSSISDVDGSQMKENSILPSAPLIVPSKLLCISMLCSLSNCMRSNSVSSNWSMNWANWLHVCVRSHSVWRRSQIVSGDLALFIFTTWRRLSGDVSFIDTSDDRFTENDDDSGVRRLNCGLLGSTGDISLLSRLPNDARRRHEFRVKEKHLTSVRSRSGVFSPSESESMNRLQLGGVIGGISSNGFGSGFDLYGVELLGILRSNIFGVRLCLSHTIDFGTIIRLPSIFFRLANGNLDGVIFVSFITFFLLATASLHGSIFLFSFNTWRSSFTKLALFAIGTVDRGSILCSKLESIEPESFARCISDLNIFAGLQAIARVFSSFADVLIDCKIDLTFGPVFGRRPTDSLAWKFMIVFPHSYCCLTSVCVYVFISGAISTWNFVDVTTKFHNIFVFVIFTSPCTFISHTTNANRWRKKYTVLFEGQLISLIQWRKSNVQNIVENALIFGGCEESHIRTAHTQKTFYVVLFWFDSWIILIKCVLFGCFKQHSLQLYAERCSSSTHDLLCCD